MNPNSSPTLALLDSINLPIVISGGAPTATFFAIGCKIHQNEYARFTSLILRDLSDANISGAGNLHPLCCVCVCCVSGARRHKYQDVLDMSPGHTANVCYMHPKVDVLSPHPHSHTHHTLVRPLHT